MNRWFIREIRIYSHDSRTRPVAFGPGVNVITGDSNTGKSALLMIVDYTLGSTKSSIPDFVRRRTSWVAVLWERSGERLAVYRATPRGARRQSEDFYVETSRNVTLVDDATLIVGNTNREGALQRIGSCFGIAGRNHETVGSLSPRHVMPFLVQGKNTINDDYNIVWGLDAKHKPSTLAWFPYFVGVDTEEAVERRDRIRTLRRRLRQLEKSEEADRVIVEKAEVILAEARALEMTTVVTPSEDEIVTELRRLSEWQPLDPVQAPASEMRGLRDREDGLRRRDRHLRAQLAELRASSEAVQGFSGAATEQAKRLEPVEFLGDSKEAPCAFCGGPPRAMESIAPLRAGLAQLRSELREVRRERPRIEEQTRNLARELESVRAELTTVQRDIRARWQLERTSESAIALERNKMRLVGRASIFVEAWKPKVSQGPSELDEIKRQLLALRGSEPDEGREEALESVRIRINHHATSIASELPFGVFQGSPLDLNPKTLQVSTITQNRRIPMDELGSDENSLTLHVSFSLALQRILAERDAPVPGVVLYDQLSRPYFPTPPRKEVTVRGRDWDSLRRYFAALFRECKEHPNLQLIVLEHAYLDDEPEFVDATRERWDDDIKLVPDGWPELD